MSSDVPSRDHYLTLALFSRRTIEALKDLVSNGKRERLERVLPDAIESLQAATDSRQLTGRYALRVASSYDQVRTINELFPKEQVRLDMIETLRGLQGPLAPAKQKELALSAIEFFYAIENRALRSYRQGIY